MDDTAHATKADISLVQSDISLVQSDISLLKTDMVGLAQRIGNVEMGIDSLKNDLMDYMDKKTEETKRHFDVVAEDLKHDMWGIHKDKISVLEDRSNDHGKRLTVIEKQLAI